MVSASGNCKKDGNLRFCVDYRKLNQVTKKDVYPLPRCDDALEALSGAILYTHLDLVRGYWQLGVNKVDREKTAFSTPEGHFQFKRVPFGLINAPATFSYGQIVWFILTISSSSQGISKNTTADWKLFWSDLKPLG